MKRVFKMSELPPGVFERFAWKQGPRAEYWLPEGADDVAKNRRYGKAAERAAAAAGQAKTGGGDVSPPVVPTSANPSTPASKPQDTARAGGGQPPEGFLPVGSIPVPRVTAQKAVNDLIGGRKMSAVQAVLDYGLITDTTFVFEATATEKAAAEKLANKGMGGKAFPLQGVWADLSRPGESALITGVKTLEESDTPVFSVKTGEATDYFDARKVNMGLARGNASELKVAKTTVGPVLQFFSKGKMYGAVLSTSVGKKAGQEKDRGKTVNVRSSANPDGVKTPVADIPVPPKPAPTPRKTAPKLVPTTGKLPTPTPPPTPVVGEPHEMTLDNHVRNWVAELKKKRPDYAHLYDAEKVLTGKGADSLAQYANARREHKAAVMSAIAAGKSVPPEVLADYPDLASKVKSPPPIVPPSAMSAPLTPTVPLQVGPKMRPKVGEIQKQRLRIAELVSAGADPEIAADMYLDKSLQGLTPAEISEVTGGIVGQKLPASVARERLVEWLSRDHPKPPKGRRKFAEGDDDETPELTAKRWSVAGDDGEIASALLGRAMRRGRQLLTHLAERAVRRMLEKPNPMAVRNLFDDEEYTAIADAIAATQSAANLLGRYRVREMAKHTRKQKQAFSAFAEDLTPFGAFADAPPEILAPENAVGYFQKLEPGLKDNQRGFSMGMRRQGFTIAATTDKVLTDKVKQVIARAMEGGPESEFGASAIREILERAGVSPANPQYADMVFRTNMMDAYQTGTMKELEDPGMKGMFPVWQYVGIRDGRQGEDHEPHFDKFYSSDRTFADVRGERIFNCRCVPKLIDRYSWQDLQRNGAVVEE